MIQLQLVIEPRNAPIAQWVQDCAAGKLPFDVLCERVAALGYSTAMLHEMVHVSERSKR